MSRRQKHQKQPKWTRLAERRKPLPLDEMFPPIRELAKPEQAYIAAELADFFILRQAVQQYNLEILRNLPKLEHFRLVDQQNCDNIAVFYSTLRGTSIWIVSTGGQGEIQVLWLTRDHFEYHCALTHNKCILCHNIWWTDTMVRLALHIRPILYHLHISSLLVPHLPNSLIHLVLQLEDRHHFSK